ncbi:MAG: hypothetical protein LBC76_08185 [Treponema sp.]|jgi:hypothetical protein|nr:hypothetical protein [Treponema sp.]
MIVKHDFYIICYPNNGNPNDYRCVVEEFEHPHFYSDILVSKYGDYIRWGPYEQESWAVKDAIRLEDEIQKSGGQKPTNFKREY